MHRIRLKILALRRGMADLVTGPLAFALLPALLLAAFRAGGETALLVAAIALPLALFTIAMVERGALRLSDHQRRGTDPVSGRSFEDTLDRALVTGARRGVQTGCIMLELEAHDRVLRGQGPQAAQAMTGRSAQLLRRNLRRDERMFYLGGGRFGIAVAPAPGIDAQSLARLAERLRERLRAGLETGERDPDPGIRCGAALSAQDGCKTAAGLIRAATAAMGDGTSCHDAPLHRQRRASGKAGPTPPGPGRDIARALERGEIRAWFQPQLLLETGDISGVEALARWHHPREGLIMPPAFLPLVSAAGLHGALMRQMLDQALAALNAWQENGCSIGRVAINLAPENLRDPAIAETIAWELDRHRLAPDRLCIEILETVVAASCDDITARNIRRLRELGCRIDLDDFGTGNTSISSLRRFSVDRLKIDRSFVRQIDRDIAQRRMVAAILTMARELGLDTLGEGVETAGEHACLAALGCGHVQGFAIARPMPFERILTWARTHRETLESSRELRSGTG